MIFALILSLLASLFSYKFLLLKANVNWDESVYLAYAYKISQALHNLDFSYFFRLTLEQFGHPPLQSWLMGMPFSAISYTISGARTITLIFFFLSSMLVSQITKSISSKKTSYNQLIPLILFITSPAILFYSVISMKEMYGIFFSLLTVFLYIKVKNKKSLVFPLLSSLSLTLLFFIKYYYSILIAIGITLDLIFLLAQKSKLKHLKDYSFIVTPFVAIASAWILFPTNKLARFIFDLKNPWSLTEGLSDATGYLLFYPRAILYMYSANVVIGSLLLLSILISFFYFQNRYVRLLLFFILPNIIITARHIINLEERFIMTCIPFLFILAGTIYSDLLSKIIRNTKGKQSKYLKYILIASIIVIIFYEIPFLPQKIYGTASYFNKTAVFNQTDFHDLWFEYDTSKWPKALPQEPFEKPADVYKYLASKINLDKPYEIVGRANDFAPDYSFLMLSLAKEKGLYPKDHYDRYIITIKVLPSSRFYTRDYRLFNEWTLENVKTVENDTNLKLLDKKLFEEMQVEVGIFVPKIDNR
jgi:hypothetical protein